MLSSLFPDENRQVLEELVLDKCSLFENCGMSPTLLCQHGQSLLKLQGTSRHSLISVLCGMGAKSAQNMGINTSDLAPALLPAATCGRSHSLPPTMREMTVDSLLAARVY